MYIWKQVFFNEREGGLNIYVSKASQTRNFRLEDSTVASAELYTNIRIWLVDIVIESALGLI